MKKIFKHYEIEIDDNTPSEGEQLAKENIIGRILCEDFVIADKLLLMNGIIDFFETEKKCFENQIKEEKRGFLSLFRKDKIAYLEDKLESLSFYIRYLDNKIKPLKSMLEKR